MWADWIASSIRFNNDGFATANALMNLNDPEQETYWWKNFHNQVMI